MKLRLPAAAAAVALVAGGLAAAPPQAEAACTSVPAEPAGANPAPQALPAAQAAPAAETVGRIDLFARGTDNALWHRWWDLGKPWTCWQSLRGDLASAPGAASHDNHVVHLNALGPDGRIKDRSFSNVGMLNGGWSLWDDLGTQTFASAPAVASWGTGHLEVFALDHDQKVQHTWFRFGGGGWSGWYGFTGEQRFQGSPAAAAYAPGKLHLYARGLDNRLYQRWLTGRVPGEWSDWVAMGDKQFTSSPGAVSWGPKHLEVFALGQDSKVWHNWYRFDAGAWSGWYALDGPQTFKEAPAAVSHAPGRLNLFALGTDNRIWARHLSGPGTWTSWTPMGDEQFTSAPAAASWTRQVNQ
ncbi:hypothetical protein [Kribbella sp. CA-247076]|uniref:hypothetical protein n=1 Tax=Kribbella sp. CA-247076 TaxID=3239941 RepID=UPI003D8EC370